MGGGGTWCVSCTALSCGQPLLSQLVSGRDCSKVYGKDGHSSSCAACSAVGMREISSSLRGAPYDCVVDSPSPAIAGGVWVVLSGLQHDLQDCEGVAARCCHNDQKLLCAEGIRSRRLYAVR